MDFWRGHLKSCIKSQLSDHLQTELMFGIVDFIDLQDYIALALMVSLGLNILWKFWSQFWRTFFFHPVSIINFHCLTNREVILPQVVEVSCSIAQRFEMRHFLLWVSRSVIGKQDSSGDYWQWLGRFFWVLCLENTVVAAMGIDKLDIAELRLSCTLGPRWDVVIIRSDFKSDTIFGFLNPNYTGQVLVFLWNPKMASFD